MDRIRNEVYRDELKTELIEVTIKQGQLRWLGHVARMGEERFVTEKGKGECKEEVGKAYEAKGENGRTQGKRAKTEKSGNNYGGETHKTQLLITLHLTVTWVSELSKVIV